MKRYVLLLFISLLMHSCALVTSYKRFTIERKSGSSFSAKKCYSDEGNYSVFFYEDGSCLLVESIDFKELDSHLESIDYKIYGKWSGNQQFHWGVYNVRLDTIEMEFLEKVDQWGFMDVCRWKAVLKNEGQVLNISPGPENREIKELNYFPLPHRGIGLQEKVHPDSVKIDPSKAWVN